MIILPKLFAAKQEKDDIIIGFDNHLGLYFSLF